MKSIYKSKRQKKAFTLIELLIVIAIIGILFVVLISRVNFATDKAKATGVQTDFRAFQVAFEQVSKENAGFATFGWDTGDANGNRIRDSYDEGDTDQDGVEDPNEIWTGRKTYGETWNNVYTLKNPKPGMENDYSAVSALETAINANLDPKLHITIANPDASGRYLITMANQARDPWGKEYHGEYLTNALNDNMDRGAIIIYSDGPNGKNGSEHHIANGVVTVTVPGNNVAGQDDYAIISCYTYANGYGETKTATSGFVNNQQSINNSGNSSSQNPSQPDNNETTQHPNGLYFGRGYSIAMGEDLMTMTFFEDGCMHAYMNGYINSADDVVYTDSAITLDGNDFLYIRNNGESLEVAGMGMFLTLTNEIFIDRVLNSQEHLNGVAYDQPYYVDENILPGSSRQWVVFESSGDLVNYEAFDVFVGENSYIINRRPISEILDLPGENFKGLSHGQFLSMMGCVTGIKELQTNPIDQYSWEQLQIIAKKGLTADELKTQYGIEVGQVKDHQYVLVDVENEYNGFVFMYCSHEKALFNDAGIRVSGGYKDASISTTTNNLYNSMDLALKGVIKSVNIKYNRPSDASIQEMTAKVFLPSAIELGAKNLTGIHTQDGETFEFFIDREQNSAKYNAIYAYEYSTRTLDNEYHVYSYHNGEKEMLTKSISPTNEITICALFVVG